MIEIDSIRSAISQLCERLQVKRLDIFGSAATDQFTVDSDVDVLVQFDREPGDLFNRYFDLKEGLEQVFGRPVDIVLEDSLKNPYFKLAIEQVRKNVYAA